MSGRFRHHLQNEYVKRTERNRSYSLRAFATQLGIGSSDLSKLLSEKRRVTPNMIKRLAPKLGLTASQTRQFVQLEENKSIESIKPTVTFRELKKDTFRVIADWYHFAILESLKIEGSKQDVGWISKKLGLKSIVVSSAIERLKRVGFLKENDNGQWSDDVGPTTMLSSYRSSQARRRLQNQVLDLAAEALAHVPITKREQSAVIMAVDSSKIGEARHLIDQFRKQMIDLLAASDQPKDQIAILNISLFPVSTDEAKNHATQTKTDA